MDAQERYADAVCRLNACGYVVCADEAGYDVQCLTACDNWWHVDGLVDLVDLANSLEWDKQRQIKMPIKLQTASKY